jgi:hypothetical protein
MIVKLLFLIHYSNMWGQAGDKNQKYYKTNKGSQLKFAETPYFTGA